MSRGTNKGIQMTRDAGMRLLFTVMSKAAIFDLAVDLVRRVEGNEHLDGEQLLDAFRAAHEPVRLLRRDLPLRVKTRDRSTDADRAAIVDVVDLLTSAPTWGRTVDALVLIGRLRAMKLSRGQGERDLRELVHEGRLERVIERHDDGAIGYRLPPDEWRRRQLARLGVSTARLAAQGGDRG